MRFLSMGYQAFDLLFKYGARLFRALSRGWETLNQSTLICSINLPLILRPYSFCSSLKSSKNYATYDHYEEYVGIHLKSKKLLISADWGYHKRGNNEKTVMPWGAIMHLSHRWGANCPADFSDIDVQLYGDEAASYIWQRQIRIIHGWKIDCDDEPTRAIRKKKMLAWSWRCCQRGEGCRSLCWGNTVVGGWFFIGSVTSTVPTCVNLTDHWWKVCWTLGANASSHSITLSSVLFAVTRYCATRVGLPIMEWVRDPRKLMNHHICLNFIERKRDLNEWCWMLLYRWVHRKL